MRWPWRREARPIEPRLAADPKVIELQTAKEILAEVFGAWPGSGMVERLLSYRTDVLLHPVMVEHFWTVIFDSGFTRLSPQDSTEPATLAMRGEFMGINISVLEGIRQNAFDYGIDYSLIEEFLTFRGSFRRRQSKAKEIIEGIMIEHGKEVLLMPVAQLAKVEYGIRGIDPRVRDHVVHALLSFLLGIFINEHFLKPREQSVNSFQWKLAGLFHDVGYPAQIGQDILTRYTGQLNNIKKELSSPEPDVYFKIVPVGLNKLTNGVDSFDLIQNCLDRWGLKIDAKYEYANRVKSGTVCHGIISSLSVLSIIDMLYDKNNSNRDYDNIQNPQGINWNQLHFERDVVPACAAIFVHNLPERCFQSARLDRNRAPLPYLLRLSDCLQDWERPSAKDLKGRPDSDFDIYTQSDRLVFRIANSNRRIQIKEEITSAIMDPYIEIL